MGFPTDFPSPGGGALPIFKAHLFVARQSGGQLQEPDGAGDLVVGRNVVVFFLVLWGVFTGVFVVFFGVGPGKNVVVSSFFFFGWGQFSELFFFLKRRNDLLMYQ